VGGAQGYSEAAQGSDGRVLSWKTRTHLTKQTQLCGFRHHSPTHQILYFRQL